MPFQKGQSGNPSGQRTKRQWIKEKERIREARETWRRLLRIRDDLVLERKQVMGPDGPIEVDVVPSTRDYINCCKEILNRAIGLSKQEVELTGKDGGPIQTEDKSEQKFDLEGYRKAFDEFLHSSKQQGNARG